MVSNDVCHTARGFDFNLEGNAEKRDLFLYRESEGKVKAKNEWSIIVRGQQSQRLSSPKTPIRSFPFSHFEEQLSPIKNVEPGLSATRLNLDWDEA